MHRCFVDKVAGSPAPIVEVAQGVVIDRDSRGDVTTLSAHPFGALVNGDHFNTGGFHVVEDGDKIGFVELRSRAGSGINDFVERKDAPLLLCNCLIDDCLNIGKTHSGVDVI